MLVEYYNVIIMRGEGEELTLNSTTYIFCDKGVWLKLVCRKGGIVNSSKNVRILISGNFNIAVTLPNGRKN